MKTDSTVATAQYLGNAMADHFPDVRKMVDVGPRSQSNTVGSIPYAEESLRAAE